MITLHCHIRNFSIIYLFFNVLTSCKRNYKNGICSHNLNWAMSSCWLVVTFPGFVSVSYSSLHDSGSTNRYILFDVLMSTSLFLLFTHYLVFVSDHSSFTFYLIQVSSFQAPYMWILTLLYMLISFYVYCY